jgi:4-amino-4-deoxy-L-arabinose transferase-like glycosyltransferase
VENPVKKEFCSLLLIKFCSLYLCFINSKTKTHIMENLNMAPPGPKGPFSENWLVEAILVTLLCCLPFGVVGIIFAAQVNTKQQAGDMEGAEKSRREAAKWTKLGFWIGLGVLVLYVLFWLVLGVSFLGAASSMD